MGKLSSDRGNNLPRITLLVSRDGVRTQLCLTSKLVLFTREVILIMKEAMGQIIDVRIDLSLVLEGNALFP